MRSTAPTRLSRVAAVPLAFGSIAGSGILSLPSAVYSESGSASTVVWVIAAAACLPMLVMFRDAMALSGDGDAIQALVARGLGRRIGAAMPLMFLSVVVIGLPTGCVIAGRYVEDGLGWPEAAAVLAPAILVAALAANLLGAGVGRGVQLAGGAILVATGAVLIVVGIGRAAHPVPLVPDASAWGHVLPGVLLAFWAFVGFENLTFLGRDLRDPARDFLPVSATALVIYGAFALGLTLTIAATVEQASVDPVTGLLQLASTSILQGGVAVVALAAMVINAAAWVRGVDHLMTTAARAADLPSRLATHPLHRTAVLGCLFTATLVILTVRPDLTVAALAASSAVFVLIYLICTVAYVRAVGVRPRTVLNALLLPAMIITLVASGTRSLYGVAVAGICLGWCFLHHRRKPQS